MTLDAKGDVSERPQHKVTVPAFWMGCYPITQAQWRVVAFFEKVERELKLDRSNFKGSRRPVEQIDWHNAVEFCVRLSKRLGEEDLLPNGAEWEYAPRRGLLHSPFALCSIFFILRIHVNSAGKR